MCHCLPCSFLGDNLSVQGCIDIAVSKHAFEVILMIYVYPALVCIMHVSKPYHLVSFGCWGVAQFPDLNACLSGAEEKSGWVGVVCLFLTILWSETKTVPLKHVVESFGPFCFASVDAMFSSFLLIAAQLLVSVFLSVFQYKTN